ncbi:hypothetical protein PTSG_06762 [Salpingoeca rosetta]|uniref:PCIF1 WW domain-containing protein n=1 Tax=Salpingoeca rosetta (strain ATCC 50818 / BSB-021) TaxID=946362 RepID=F2UEQ7_SALR5|nr:uncharacterized protein PTSG_06762 [Salpingoeca rosetta]EGD75107.1 hypothetical protein PTSG_06762 [Salpingoeca rosetta]|eukprot:XP_004992160.1 hypothetical protein PTSG_06762 [Salpingoeca rosetta]
MEEGEGDLRVIALEHDGDRVSINKFHHEKLRRLYAIHSKQHVDGCRYHQQQAAGSYDTQEAAASPCECPVDEQHFARCLYVLARRYKTFIGDEAEGGAFHAAAPETTFDTLREDFEVSQEQFASPFNCHFRKFCSAFPDIDVWFGSVGSFFDFSPVEGSFETGPPYTEEVMDMMADRLEHLLDNSTGPLSFIVFVPQWRSPACHALVSMDNSRYLRAHFVAPGHQHTYITGVQHTEGGQGGHRYYVVPHGTELFFLQNDAAYAKWPPTQHKINRFKASLGIKVDAGPFKCEPDLVPQRPKTKTAATVSTGRAVVDKGRHDDRDDGDGDGDDDDDDDDDHGDQPSKRAKRSTQ